MARKPERNLIVGLDIGTSKVVAIVGELGADGTIEVVGVGSHPSRGLKKGVVVRLGRQSVDERLQRFLTLASATVAKRIAEINYIDMRYTNGFSVGWNGNGRTALASAK